MPDFEEVSRGEDAEQAKWLAETLQHSVRFDHTGKRWHVWDGAIGQWRPDKTKVVYETALAHVYERLQALVISDLGDQQRIHAEKMTRKLLDKSRLEAALDVLTWHPGYKTDGEDWDQDPYLLGCANGVVDLRTGQLIKDPDPQAILVTRSTGIKFDPSKTTADAPRFMSFLSEVTSNDGELALFYLAWFGYSLFGLTSEQKFLILTGLGRNGKGALATAMRHVFGEYSADTDQSLYMRSKFGAARSDGARADLMALKGKRIAIMSEPPGGAFNEEMLKAHTGGDPITARALYSNNVITWEPTHSVTFLTNEPPSVQDIGPAMAARVMVADFRERFDGEKEDKQLYRKLQDEAPGILNILVRMAVQWFESVQAGQGGLVLPARVTKASAEYLSSNDPIGRALDEAFVFEKGAKTPARIMYDAYCDWHAREDAEGTPMSNTAFALQLAKRSINKIRLAQGTVYTNVRPKSAVELADG